MALKLRYDFANYPTLTGQADSLGVASTPDLSITRASTAMMKDADGWLREVQDGEARFPGATFSHNLCLQSQDFSTTWAEQDQMAAVVGNEAVAPDGTTTADLLVDNGATGTGSVWIQQTITFAENTTYVYSVSLKANGLSWARVEVGGLTGQAINAYVNLSTGAFGATGAQNVDAGVIDQGSGWYRVWIAFTTDTDTSGSLRIRVAEADGDITIPLDGGSSIYAWGAQLEDVSGAWDSQNLILQSNSFDTTWSNSRTTETSGKADPDGGTSAWGLNEDATAANTHFINQGFAIDPGTYIYSVYAKASNRSWMYLQPVGFRRPGGGAHDHSHFDLSNGVVGTTGIGIEDHGIESIGDGWYRCWVKFTATTGDTSGVFYIGIGEADDDLIFDGLSQESILIYKAQLEKTKPNQTTPGTYTATTTAAVTNYSPSDYIATTTAAVSSLSGTSDGLLVEESRTNICLQSEDFGTTWTVSGGIGAVNTNQTIAPDGSLTADQLIDDGLGTPGSAFVSQAVTVATTTTYTYSLFAKADQLSWVRLTAQGFTTPANSDAYFDLSSGAFGTVDAGFDDNGFEDYGNGWYRIWVAFTTDAADTSGNIRAFVADADADSTVDADGTSSIFLWGAQLEAGRTAPTAYIATTTGSVTRNQDVVTADISSAFGPDETGSWYVHAQTTAYYNGSDNTDPSVIRVTGNTPNAFMSIAEVINESQGPMSRHGFGVVGNGGLISNNNWNAGQITEGSYYKYAVRTVENDWKHYCNGIEGTTDTTADLQDFSTIASLEIGDNYSGVTKYMGLIAEIAYFNEGLDNATLDGLSDGTISVSAASPGELQERRRHIIKRRRTARRLGIGHRERWAGRRVR